MRKLLALAVPLAALAAGCGGSRECKLDDPGTCASGMVCETVQGRDKPLCFPPIEVQGRVVDLDVPDGGIRGARVTAVDQNGAPLGTVAVTDPAGGYTVQIPTARTAEDGGFPSEKLTLRAAAKDYVPFPSGIRSALPLDTASATQASADAPYVVSGGGTIIALSALPANERGLPSISGTVQYGASKSALVVSQDDGGTNARSAIADVAGDFILFNVPGGTYTVRGYTRGQNYTPAEVVVDGGDVTGVTIAQSAAPAATVNGSVSIVSATGATSVILAVKSTFDPVTGRGEAVAGLRAPDPGTAPNLTGAFSIAGVPDGEYAVLAGFENDGLVRDPDVSLGGTALQYVTVAGGTASALQTFKVTSAITMVGPGADAVEAVSATPTFTWVKYPSTDHYVIQVVDALGQQLWTATVAQPNTANVTAVYPGSPALAADHFYQWWVEAIATGGTTLSRTEDLRGVFRISGL